MTLQSINGEIPDRKHFAKMLLEIVEKYEYPEQPFLNWRVGIYDGNAEPILEALARAYKEGQQSR